MASKKIDGIPENLLMTEKLYAVFTDEELKQARWEFRFLISRCGCSKAALVITEDDVKEATKSGISLKPKEPSCSPKTCFPTLYALLYPHGGCHAVSDHVTRHRRRKKREAAKETANK